MKLEVEIRRPAKPSPIKGTLSWLMANIGHVKIGTTKAGNNAAWLVGKDDKRLTVLCAQNHGPEEADGNPDGKIRVAAGSTGGMYEDADEDTLWTDMVFTDAAYRVVLALAFAARDEILSMIEEGDAALPEDDEVEVVVVRVKDRDAAALARSVKEDPVVMPMLRDRVKEIAASN